MHRLSLAICKAVALYGLIAWVYVAVVALVTPNTLSLPLTHLTHWPRTDTFGEACFALSCLAFIVHQTFAPRPRDDRPPMR